LRLRAVESTQLDEGAGLVHSPRVAALTRAEPDALVALRDALKTAPEHFTDGNLERAHVATYHKALVDIISMVKHAALDTAPLLTAHERVEAAVENVVEGRDLTAEQQAWMDRIKLHLVQNLSIDRDDFSLVLLLSARSHIGPLGSSKHITAKPDRQRWRTEGGSRAVSALADGSGRRRSSCTIFSSVPT
jgi:hypothetical protein